MKILVDFKCPNDHVTEAYIDNTAQNIVCLCGEMAERQVSCTQNLRMNGAPIHINSDKWAKTREDNWRRCKERDG